MRERLAVLRHPDFRLLWLAHSGSVLGDMVVLTALTLYVTDLTGDPTDLGIVLTAQAAPLVLLLLVAGVVADRLPRHRIILATDIVRGVVQAALAVLVLTDATQIWHLVIAGVLFGAAEAFARPASTGLVPQTVPERDVQEARALIGMSENVAEIGGPAIGTGLVVGLSAAGAFAFDAVTFLLSALLLVRVRPRDRSSDRAATLDPVTETVAGPGDWRADLRDGWREFTSRRWVWVTVAAATVALLCAYAPLFVLGPTLAREHFGSTGHFGLILTVFGVGAVSGALTGLRWKPRHPMRAASLIVIPWPLIAVAMAAGAPLTAVLGVAAVAGWGIALFDVWWHTALSERIPPDALSRVSAFDWMGSLALLPLGYAAVGPLSELVGADTIAVFGGILASSVYAAVLAVPEIWRLERLDDLPPVAPALAPQRA